MATEELSKALCMGYMHENYLNYSAKTAPLSVQFLGRR